MPSLPVFLLFLVALPLAAAVQVGAMRIVFEKLGLPSEYAVLLLALALLGGMVNLPLFTLKAKPPVPRENFPPIDPALQDIFPAWPEKTLITVNVGGCVLPILFAFYLLFGTPLAYQDVVFAIALVSLVAYAGSALVPGVGVVMSMLAAPLAAAFSGVGLDAAHAAPLAYIAGTLGVLLGADLLRLAEAGRCGEAAISIGGAGIFDGIFLSGILAVLLS
ncbi:MAG: DUF1614 domain-containing protein [Rhodocyclaceae bacterium]